MNHEYRIPKFLWTLGIIGFFFSSIQIIVTIAVTSQPVKTYGDSPSYNRLDIFIPAIIYSVLSAILILLSDKLENRSQKRERNREGT